MKFVTTLLFLLRDGEMLLAMKKRGHGVGRWNGTGGKVKPGETVSHAAVRECEEEIGVTPVAPKLVGRLKFLDRSDPDFYQDCHVFVATEWQGKPRETEEMRPQWFATSAIPYEDMWPDDRVWLPLLLQEKLFNGSVTTDSLAGNSLVQHDIRKVHRLED
jgi:8-oxo-dGTP pyrophosphatase MutT (NUDIX family)